MKPRRRNKPSLFTPRTALALLSNTAVLCILSRFLLSANCEESTTYYNGTLQDSSDTSIITNTFDANAVMEKPFFIIVLRNSSTGKEVTQAKILTQGRFTVMLSGNNDEKGPLELAWTGTVYTAGASTVGPDSVFVAWPLSLPANQSAAEDFDHNKFELLSITKLASRQNPRRYNRIISRDYKAANDLINPLINFYQSDQVVQFRSAVSLLQQVVEKSERYLRQVGRDEASCSIARSWRHSWLDLAQQIPDPSDTDANWGWKTALYAVHTLIDFGQLAYRSKGSPEEGWPHVALNDSTNPNAVFLDQPSAVQARKWLIEDLNSVKDAMGMFSKWTLAMDDEGKKGTLADLLDRTAKDSAASFSVDQRSVLTKWQSLSKSSVEEVPLSDFSDLGAALIKIANSFSIANGKLQSK